jgi:glycerol-3-phosphate dehydrogenase
MGVSLVLTAVQHGAIMANHVEVTELHKKFDEKKQIERICAATLCDKMTGETFTVKTRVS